MENKKKGLLYIDWSISIGIFIIYLVSIFVFISPTLARDYSEEYLTTIARVGFENNAYHTLLVYPVFVQHNQSETAFELEIPSELQPLNNPLQVGLFYNNNGTLEEIVNSNIQQDRIIFVPENLIYDGSVNIYYMIISDTEEFYTHYMPGPGTPPKRYAFGIPKVERGLSSNKFNYLKTNFDYQGIKREFNYPESKEIAIDVYQGVDQTTTPILSIEPDITTQNDTVFVAQWSAWNINKNSEKEIVTISIQTW